MINSKDKGKRGERDVANKLREHGYENARRGVQYQGGPNSPDVVGLPGYHIEVKWTQRTDMYGWMEQAKNDCGENTPIVVHKKDGKEWLVIMTLEDFLNGIDKQRKSDPMAESSEVQVSQRRWENGVSIPRRPEPY